MLNRNVEINVMLWFSARGLGENANRNVEVARKETPGQHSLTPSSRRSTPTRPNFHTYPKVISQLALRIIIYEYPLEAILAICFLSVTGHLPDKFPHDQWIEAVRWHGDTKIAAITETEAEWADAKIILATLENVVVEAESQHGVVVWSSAQICPPTFSTDSYPLQLIVLPGGKSNGTSLRLCMWKQRDSEVGTSRTVGGLDLRHVFRSKKVLVFNAMEDITNDEYLARS